MYTEITKEELIKEAQIARNFIVTKGLTENALIDLSSSLCAERGGTEEIFWLDGGDSLNYPSFDSIKLIPRFVIKDGGIRTKTGGLILPQNEPIILVLANFQKLLEEDQQKYISTICKKEETDYFPHNYLHEDSIVILGLGESDAEPSFSYKLEVRSLK